MKWETDADDHDETGREQAVPVPVERLTTSYRFDDDLARLLTRFQYADDGLSLDGQPDRRLPPAAVSAPTAGIDAVFDPAASLVVVLYDDRSHRMVNPIETTIITALADALGAGGRVGSSAGGGGSGRPLAEGPDSTGPEMKPGAELAGDGTPGGDVAGNAGGQAPSVGVVTPHNAQRGALDRALPAGTTANTVEKYQGDERDIIAVSATVSEPEFARREERFILNPRRLLVAISRSRLLSIVVCSRSLFEVAPADSDRLDTGPVWARLFTLAAGPDATPAWHGTLQEFVPSDPSEHADVPVAVYPGPAASR
jgi:hypothetical protein